jgi:hypothetical protein
MSTAALRTLAQPQPQPQPQRRPAPELRPSLEVVQQRRRRVRRRRLAPILAGALVSASLFLVVIGHAELTQGQVRLSAVQQAVTAAETTHRQDVLALANLENPARILGVAEKTLHMAPPAGQQQVAHVPLDTPLPNPTVSTAASAPAGPAAKPGT